MPIVGLRELQAQGLFPPSLCRCSWDPWCPRNILGRKKGLGKAGEPRAAPEGPTVLGLRGDIFCP